MSAAISLAKQGAKNFINMLEETDRAGVVSYSSSATADYAMSPMIDANKTAARAAIDPLSASGSTNIGSGLQTSLGQIVGDGSPTSNEIIVLLSDGMHNTGTHPDNVLPAIKNRKAVVYTIGLGSVDAALMSRIASETGGTYLFASNASQLNAHYLQILGDLRNNGMIENINSEMEATQTATVPVYIDSFTGSSGVNFVLTWLAPGYELGFSLYRPDGSLVTDASPGVTYTYDADNGSKRYQIDGPPSGTWGVVIDNPAPSPVEYSLVVMSAPLDVTFKASPNRASFTYPEPVLVRAVVITDNKVVGAEVKAVVTMPGGDTVQLALYDDGNEVHGDEGKDDGIYSAYFSDFSVDGSYTFDVTVDTEGSYTSADEEDGGYFEPEPVDRFIRKSGFSVVVNGVPDIVSATIDIHPETLNTKSNGRFITAHVELYGHDVHDIDIATVVLKDNVAIASALSSPSQIGDFDSDGNLDLMIKFSRKDVIDYLESALKTNMPVEFVVEGQMLSGEIFRGASIIQVIRPGKKQK